MTNKANLSRWLFVLASIIIVGLILWNTYQFFYQLKENERNKMKIWASAFEEFQQVDLSNDDWNSKLILEILQSNTTTPMILHTLKEDKYDVNNLESNVLDNPESRTKLIERFSSEYTPIEVKYKEEVLQIIYYGNSPIINKIKYYPAVLIVIILLFFLAVYFFFQTSKSAEQNKLWAGMAKETAHQIGTPLSSLVGWAEILEEEDLVKVTHESFEYLKNRSSKLIDFDLKVPNQSIPVYLNAQLYGWTIENLVKNGIDAMRGQGSIRIEIVTHGKRASVLISDTGKGIAKKDYKKIFQPGFTTKKRGWGLGLSLAKRIIEGYHKGRIHVLKSSKNEGTTIELQIPLIQ